MVGVVSLLSLVILVVLASEAIVGERDGIEVGVGQDGILRCCTVSIAGYRKLKDARS